MLTCSLTDCMADIECKFKRKGLSSSIKSECKDVLLPELTKMSIIAGQLVHRASDLVNRWMLDCFDQGQDTPLDNRPSQCQRLHSQAIKIGWSGYSTVPRDPTHRLHEVNDAFLRDYPKVQVPVGRRINNLIDQLAKDLATNMDNHVIFQVNLRTKVII